MKGNKIISSNCNYPAASFPRIMGRLLLLPGGREWGSQDSDTEQDMALGGAEKRLVGWQRRGGVFPWSLVKRGPSCHTELVQPESYVTPFHSLNHRMFWSQECQ